MQFIGKTQDGTQAIYAEKGKLRTREDRRTRDRATGAFLICTPEPVVEEHIYTDEEVARELELKVRYSVHSQPPFGITVRF